MTNELKRDVEFTTRFKRDFKREKKGRHRTSVDADLMAVIELLADDRPLPSRLVDHALSGNWSDHRDCHLKPDLVLIYRKSDPSPDEDGGRPVLQLVRLGSHSELGL